jgi:hypothetical protein
LARAEGFEPLFDEGGAKVADALDLIEGSPRNSAGSVLPSFDVADGQVATFSGVTTPLPAQLVRPWRPL